MIVSIIVAVAKNNVIGKNNQLVWHLPEDMKYFRDKTMGHCVVMGRKNYDSIPEKFRPLKGRTNIVVTKQENLSVPGCVVVHTIEHALIEAKKRNESECYIIGGADIYKQTIHLCNHLYYTKVSASPEGDAFFPDVDWKEWTLVSQKDFQQDDKHKYSFSICEYKKN